MTVGAVPGHVRQIGPQFDSHLDRGAIAQLLLLTESALDREICRQISRRPLGFQIGFLRALLLAEGRGGALGLAFFRKYVDLKKKVLKIPGRAAAGLVRRRFQDGGHKFCENMSYCKGKAEIRRRLDDLAGLEDEPSFKVRGGVVDSMVIFRLCMPETHPRICLRVGYFISSCESKATTEHVTQLSIGFDMRAVWMRTIPQSRQFLTVLIAEPTHKLIRQ